MEGKITLEFNCPEQETDARMAMDGAKWHFAFTEVGQIVRQKCKHADEEVFFSENDIYKILNEVSERYNLPLEY